MLVDRCLLCDIDSNRSVLTGPKAIEFHYKLKDDATTYIMPT